MNLTTRERSVAAEIARKTRAGSRKADANGNGNGHETRQYFESLEFVLQHILKTQNAEQAELFIENLVQQLRDSGINIAPTVSTPYTNTIPPEDEPEYPGDAGLERSIRSIIRWNAMAMVVAANR
jgi:pyruvate dehydrogenase E1 component